MGELALQRRDPVTSQSPVGLYLRLAGTSGSDPAAETLEVGPESAHAGQVY